MQSTVGSFESNVRGKLVSNWLFNTCTVGCYLWTNLFMVLQKHPHLVCEITGNFEPQARIITVVSYVQLIDCESFNILYLK